MLGWFKRKASYMLCCCINVSHREPEKICSFLTIFINNQLLMECVPQSVEVLQFHSLGLQLVTAFIILLCSISVQSRLIYMATILTTYSGKPQQ